MQFLLLASLLRGAGTGIMVVLLFFIGMVVVAVTGNTVMAGALSAGVSLFFLLLIITVLLHVVRFILVAGLSAAVTIKRLARRF